MPSSVFMTHPNNPSLKAQVKYESFVTYWQQRGWQLDSGTSGGADLSGLNAHLADADGAHPASSISVNAIAGVTGTTVQAVLAELKSGIGVGGSTTIRVEDEGASVLTTATAINFQGAGVTVTNAGAGEVTVVIPGGGGGVGGISGIRVEDETLTVQALATAINFSGSGVTVTDAGAGEVLVTIPGATGGGTMTDAQVEAAYNARVAVATQGDAEGGTSTTVFRWTPQRIAQAVAALAGSANTLAQNFPESFAVRLGGPSDIILGDTANAKDGFPLPYAMTIEEILIGQSATAASITTCDVHVGGGGGSTILGAGKVTIPVGQTFGTTSAFTTGASYAANKGDYISVYADSLASTVRNLTLWVIGKRNVGNVTPPTNPGTPSMLSVPRNLGGLTPDWQPGGTGNSTIDYYELQVSTDNVNWTVLQSQLAAVQYQHGPLANGTTNYYRVRAHNAAGLWSNYSASLSGTAGDVPGGAPTSLASTGVLSNQFGVTWVAPTGTANTGGLPVTGYNIVIGPVNGGSGGITASGDIAATPTSRTFTFWDFFNQSTTAILASTAYRVRIAAVNEAGTGPYASLDVTTAASGGGTPAALAPTGLVQDVAASGATSINYDWSLPTDANRTGVQVEWKQSTQTYGNTPISLAASTVTYTPAFARDVLCDFRVRATGPGGPSAWVDLFNKQCRQTPSAPRTLAAGTPTATGVTLTWVAPQFAGATNDVSGYYVEWDQQADNFASPIGNSGTLGNVLTYTIANLPTPATNYSARVRAINSVGSDAWATVSFTTAAGAAGGLGDGLQLVDPVNWGNANAMKSVTSSNATWATAAAGSSLAVQLGAVFGGYAVLASGVYTVNQTFMQWDTTLAAGKEIKAAWLEFDEEDTDFTLIIPAGSSHDLLIALLPYDYGDNPPTTADFRTATQLAALNRGAELRFNRGATWPSGFGQPIIAQDGLATVNQFRDVLNPAGISKFVIASNDQITNVAPGAGSSNLAVPSPTAGCKIAMIVGPNGGAMPTPVDPAPVTFIDTAGDDGFITAYWSVPYDGTSVSGGSAITGYDVRYKANTATTWTQASYTNAQLNGNAFNKNVMLGGGGLAYQEYMIQVRAKTASRTAKWGAVGYGTSAFSAG